MASIAASAARAALAPPHSGGRSLATTAGVDLLKRGLAAVWLLSLGTVVLLALATNLGPRVGFEVFAVRGGSMAPTIPLGAAVIAVRTPPVALRVGDIVSIRADNGVVFTHRVVEIDASEEDHWLRTKGDANAAADAAPVPTAAVIGVVELTIPLAGYLIALLATPSGLLSFLAYAVALLLAIWLLEDAERAAQPRRRLAGSPDVARA
jgi:signal peptidase I